MALGLDTGDAARFVNDLLDSSNGCETLRPQLHDYAERNGILL